MKRLLTDLRDAMRAVAAGTHKLVRCDRCGVEWLADKAAIQAGTAGCPSCGNADGYQHSYPRPRA